jgi:hypothetical protein
VVLAERVVPIGLQGVGYESVVGIDGEVSATGELGAVACPLDVATPEPIGLVGARLELRLDRERDFQSEGGDSVKEELAYGGVDRGARDCVTGRKAVLDGHSHAPVLGNLDAAAEVIADGHAPSASATDGEPLEERRAFPGGTGGAVTAVGLRVGKKELLVELELLPGDVAGMGSVDERCPLVARNGLHGDLAVGSFAATLSAIYEGPGIPRVVQRAQDSPVAKRHPGQPTFVGPFRTRAGKCRRSRLKACTTARAEPVRAKAAKR